MVEPFLGVEFVGGFYRTVHGNSGPYLTDKGWHIGPELGQGHAVFVGLLRSAAVTVSRAARGEWGVLDEVPSSEPVGLVSSEFAWLPDGTVGAPATYFMPTDLQLL